MLKTHHHKIESVLIHIVAVLFLFSTIAAAFLGYGLRQSDQTSSYKVATPVEAVGAYWKQTNWNGGADPNSEYSVQWGTTGGHSKYRQGSGVTPGGGGFTLTNGGWLESSVLNLGSKRSSYADPYTFDTVTTYMRGGNDADAARSAGWVGLSNFCTISKYPYIQYKVENTSGSSADIDWVKITAESYNVSGQVKDASTGAVISGATVNYGSGSTTTALFKYNNLIKPALAAGQPGWYAFSLDFIPSEKITIIVSKSGYNSQTKSVTLPADTCSSTSSSVNFGLTKKTSSGDSTSDSDNSTADTSTSDTSTVTASEFQKTKLPSIFTAKGSKTTDLSKVKDPKKVRDFTLHIPNKNMVVFKEVLDLSAKSTVNALKNLNKYLKMDKVGVVELDSKTLKAMNKKATLTMYKLKHASTPAVLVDGKKDTKGIVSNATYDKDKGTFSFDVSHFSKFEAAVKIEILSPTGTKITEPNTTIAGRISDPAATVTGSFNGVQLAAITPDEKTGEFAITKLVFKEGENILKLNAESKLGIVAPLAVIFTYGEKPVTTETDKSSDYRAVIIVLLVALAFAILLGYLIYKKKIHFKNLIHKEEKPAEQTKPQSEQTQSKPEEENKE